MKRILSFFLAFTAAFVLTSNANAYEVQFADMQHCTFSALLNERDFTGGEVNLDDHLVVVYKANLGRRFASNHAKISVMDTYLSSGYFNSEGVYRIEELDSYALELVFKIRLLSATAADIHWVDPSGDCTAYRFLISEQKQTGNPDYWKGWINTTDDSYTTYDLVEGHKYYVYVQGLDNLGNKTDVASTDFTAQEPGNPCVLTFYMTDSYGDGWDGGSGFRVVEDGDETFVTLNDGREGTVTYESKGGLVAIYWYAGSCCQDEIAFRICDGDGVAIVKCELGEGPGLIDDAILYAGIICTPCLAKITNLDWTATETNCTVTWNSENANGFEVAVLQKAYPTKEELAAAAVSLTDSTYTFPTKDHAIYNVFVRAICDEYQKNQWDSIVVSHVQVAPDITDDLIKQYAKPITLDYTESGDYMANAVAFGPAAKAIYPFGFYKLNITDSTTVRFDFSSATISDAIFVIYQDTLSGQPLANVGECFTTGQHKLKGTYYVLVEPMVSYGYGEYIMKISAVREMTAKTITLNYHEEGDFTDAPAIELTMGMSVVTPAKVFRYIPTDTVDVYFRLNASGGNTDGCMIFQREVSAPNIVYGFGGNSFAVVQLLKDTTYYIVLAAPAETGAHMTDTYAFDARILTNTPTQATPMTLDALVEDSFGPNDFIEEFGYNGKAYEFVLTETQRISFALELLGEHAQDTAWLNNVELRIHKDTIEYFDSYLVEFPANENWIDYMTLSGEAKGTHYFVTVVNKRGFDAQYRINLRLDRTYGGNVDNIIPISTVQVGTTYRSEFTSADPYSYNYGEGSCSNGVIEPYKVALEQGKTYKVFAHRLLEESTNFLYGCFQITVFNPKVKTGNFWAHALDYMSYVEDEWAVVTFTADTTADYTIIFGSAPDMKDLDQYLAYEFAVEEVTDLENFSMTAPLVKDRYEVSGTFTDNQKVVPMSYVKFHDNPQSWIEENGAFDVVMCGVVVGPGDTVFAEFGGNADGMIHIFDGMAGTGPNNPIIINEHPYSFPYEKGYMVNQETDSALFVVWGSFVDVSLEDLAYTFRVATSSQALAPVVVTPRVNKSSITISKTDGVAAAQTELGKLVLTAVPQNGGDVLNLTNNPFAWAIDLDANIARYEFNDADLPLGYVFAGTNPSVEVTIKRGKVGIEEVEEEAAIESAVKARKVMINGHILIVTPNGTFDMFGRKVK